MINQGEIALKDVCVCNTVAYAQQYGDVNFPDETENFEIEIKNYNGPKYHPIDEPSFKFPQFKCHDNNHENMEIFNHRSIDKIEVLDYEGDNIYDDLENVSMENTDVNESSIGFSQEHNNFETDEITNASNFHNDAYPVLNLIMKEIVDAVGNNKELFSHKEKKMKDLLSEIYNLKRQQNQSKESKSSKEKDNEWVSCNVLQGGQRPNKNKNTIFHKDNC